MDTQEKIAQVQKLVKNGNTVKEALAQAQLSANVYYARLRQKAKMKPKQAQKRKKLAQVKLVELPTTPQPMGKLFLICGDASTLADFARLYQ